MEDDLILNLIQINMLTIAFEYKIVLDRVTARYQRSSTAIETSKMNRRQIHLEHNVLAKSLLMFEIGPAETRPGAPD